jgi:branched-chain amino acid transport system ATP-binding protein
MLAITGLSKNFGGLPALRDVSFQLAKGEIVGIIGPNGAGKTTLLNCLSGVFPSSSGSITLDKIPITNLPPHKICALGMGRTFQIPRPFGRMTVLENIAVCIRSNREPNDFLQTVGMEHKKETLARNLTFHERRRLELARALATEPKVLLIDEIMAGLNPNEIIDMVFLLKRIHDNSDLSILWIEHVMKAIMETAKRIIVLHQGEKLMDSDPATVAENPKVIEIYLGEKYELGAESNA